MPNRPTPDPTPAAARRVFWAEDALDDQFLIRTAAEGIRPRPEIAFFEDGDVLQAIDGRKPDDGPHALRILRSYRSGEKLSLTVLRQRKPVSLAVTMPERPEPGDVMWDSAMPMIAPLPPVPAVPGTRVAPEVRTFPDGGGSTD